MKRVALIGNPNVGKSVVFSRLTGTRVVTSNYPGTTVGVTRGFMRVEGERVELVDVPGTYSMEPTCPAEKVALRILAAADVIVNVVDTTALERNLNLTLQVLSLGKPALVALNMADEARHLGISVDADELARVLGVPVVLICARSGDGIPQLVAAIREARVARVLPGVSGEDRWETIGRIAGRVQTLRHRHHTVLDYFEDLTLHSVAGLFVAALVLAGSLALVRLIGEGLARTVVNPLFSWAWQPCLDRLSALLGGGGAIHSVLVGDLFDGRPDPARSLGLLTMGLHVPLAIVLPYVLGFYLVLGVLEDVGYLPRLAVLLDTAMHRFGLHGLSIIPMMLGLGCNVPGIMATRILETRRERFVVATLTALCIPCTARLSTAISLLGPYGPLSVFAAVGWLAVLMVAVAAILRLFMRQDAPEIMIEIPPLRIPHARTMLQKLWMRVKEFLAEALPFVFLGVLAFNVLTLTGAMGLLAGLVEPLTRCLLGLPGETSAAFLSGLLRKDIAVGMLLPLNLSVRQLIVACVVLTTYFPCVGSLSVLVRELGLRGALASVLVILAGSMVGGFVLRALLSVLPL